MKDSLTQTEAVINNEAAQSNGSQPRAASSPAAEVPAVSQWTVRQAVMGTLVVLGIGFVFYMLFRFYMVVFIFFVAVAVQVALEPLVTWLHDRGLSRNRAVGLIFLLLLLLLAGVVWSIAPLLIRQVQTITQDFPDYYQSILETLSNSSSPIAEFILGNLPSELPSRVPAPTQSTQTLETVAPAWQFIQAESRLIFITVATFVLAYYWTLDGRWFIRQLSLRIPLEKRNEWRELSAEMESKIGDYLRGQAILCVIIGVLSLIIFLSLGIPNAVVLALFMGVFEAVPVLGPLLGAVPAVAMTLASAPEKTLWVIAALTGIQILENNLLVPRVMNDSVGVNPVSSMLAIAAFGLLFGIGGAILAIPLAAMLQILLNRILFDPASLEEDAMAISQETNVERNQFSVLKLQAQDLTQDIRKQAREDTDENKGNKEQVEDLLESVALDLSDLLSDLERAK